VAAPIIPFITEEIYQNLRVTDDPESIHHSDWPKYDKRFRDLGLERDMASVRHAVSMGRALRVANELKIRQPLASVQLVTKIPEEKAVLSTMEDILRDELNVKSIIFRENEEDLVEYSAKPNYRVLGKQLGKDMPRAASAIEALPVGQLEQLVAGKPIEIDIEGRRIPLSSDSVEIRRAEKPGLKVLNEGTLTLALDTVVTRELLLEGYVRDLVRGIQNLRKESGLEVTDRIRLELGGDSDLKEAASLFSDFIAGETLSIHMQWEDEQSDGISTDDAGNTTKKDTIFSSVIEAGEKTWKVKIARAN
ncbi:MAG: DUF5915 domain-containing protein, partial [Spirochaetaceae bacterium]|nr:DUF5915 domain-containing protein [Spirochaetaceae bacterium]